MTISVQDEKEVRRLVVEIDPDLYTKAKIQAAKEDITMKKLVSIALSHYVIRQKKG